MWCEGVWLPDNEIWCGVRLVWRVDGEEGRLTADQGQRGVHRILFLTVNIARIFYLRGCITLGMVT